MKIMRLLDIARILKRKKELARDVETMSRYRSGVYWPVVWTRWICTVAECGGNVEAAVDASINPNDHNQK